MDKSDPGNVVLPESMNADGFVEKYLRVREKEKRLYSDEEVATLPTIAFSHPHYKEWLIRKRSCENLLYYLRQKKSSLDVLEVGCGNGWLSAQISKVKISKIIGIDINLEELNQAKRVFGRIKNLKFLFGDLRSGILIEKRFDIIIFAASIQYFYSLQNIIEECIIHLKKSGEIHVLDSHFYRAADISSAQQRTVNHYTALGFPEMAGHYFHHCLEELKPFQYKILYNPFLWYNKIIAQRSPFYWICIKNKQV